MENNIIDIIRLVRAFLSNSTISIVAGALAIIPYLYKNWKNIDQKGTIVNVVAIFLSALPIFPGFGVMFLCFDKETCELIKIEQKIFFVGGLVLVLIGIQSLRKNYKQ